MSLKAYCLALLAALSSQSSNARDLIGGEYKAESYSSEGLTVGCGVSFTIAWKGDEGEPIVATGSLNYFYPNFFNRGTGIKLTAIINMKPVNINYAWFEVNGYGDTKNFIRQAGSYSNSYVANQKPDENGIFLPANAVTKGFLVGIHFEGRRLDEVVTIPPITDVGVMHEFPACIRSLASRMQ